jgi:hypothetical protein
MSANKLRACDLPKHKRRWLVGALKVAVEKEAGWLEACAVVVGLAFATNRRMEVTEDALLRWLRDHHDELPRLLSEAAELALPPAAKDRARKALTAANEAEFWVSVQAAAALAGRQGGMEARAL